MIVVQHTAYLSLGSNLGDRAANLEEAIRRLEKFGKITAKSSLYETEPVEVETQPWFLNCAIALETEMASQQLLAAALAIEQSMGRRRTRHKGPRTIDIDILFFNDSIEASAALTVPHPALHLRRFVLEPLAEIAPDLRHPVLKKSVREMLDGLPSTGGVVRKYDSNPESSGKQLDSLRKGPPLEGDLYHGTSLLVPKVSKINRALAPADPGRTRKGLVLQAVGLTTDSGVDIDSVAALLRPFAELTPPQLASTVAYINLLQKWNSRVNLTAVRNAQEIVTRHFGESFFAARELFLKDDDGTIIDLGSGAGFPGLPMAMFAPQAKVTLIESNGKKSAFLNEVIRALDLKNVTVFSHRAEEYPHASGLVVMRAVEKFESSLQLAARLAEPGGRLAAMIGHSQVEQARSLVPQCRWQEPISVPGGHSRVLLVGTL